MNWRLPADADAGVRMKKRNVFCGRLLGLLLSLSLAFAPTVALAQMPAEGELPDSPSASLKRIAQAQTPSLPQTQEPATPDPDSAAQPPAAEEAPKTDQTPAKPETEKTSQSQTSAKTPSSQRPDQEPVGTAAAGVSNSGGVTASQPAGAALAPAKQRRTRSLLIKVGALLGAGAALGTVMALSKGSPSKPPGTQ
jgi:hypothetical protein